MRPKVSVVIPVYNVEKYIERCVESVIHQTLKDIEIILVDDGSLDRSSEMCDQFAPQDARIQVIHKQNGGLASARNAGMKIATAEYLFFLDSDDWLELDGLQHLYKRAKETAVDFVKYRAIRSYWPGEKDHIPCCVESIRELKEGFYDRRRIINEVYPKLLATEQLTLGAVVGAWGALYNTDFIKRNNLYFDETIKYSEDVIFSAKVVQKAQSFYFIDSPGVYHYYYNPDSISKSFRSDRWYSCKKLIRSCYDSFQNDPEYDFEFELLYLRWFCVLLSLKEKKHIQTVWKKTKYCCGIVNDKETRIAAKSMGKVKKHMHISWKQWVVLWLIKWRFSMILSVI